MPSQLPFSSFEFSSAPYSLIRFLKDWRVKTSDNKTMDDVSWLLLCLQVFQGNWDTDTPIPNMFARRIYARFIRFNPIASHGGLICMRVEVYECQPTKGNDLGRIFKIP